ncbi:hypothetical protein LY78DRAFT_656804 [Colletotrichum sublineola]|nr:hypothetical protein LY78DRAFT_656804 [Colletotrichum sublineola]
MHFHTSFPSTHTLGCKPWLLPPPFFPPSPPLPAPSSRDLHPCYLCILYGIILTSTSNGGSRRNRSKNPRYGECPLCLSLPLLTLLRVRPQRARMPEKKKEPRYQ